MASGGERIPDQGQLLLQFRVPADSMLTVTSGYEAVQTPTILKPVIDSVDIVRRYPKEPAVDPRKVEKYVQKYLNFGDDHTETIEAKEKLDQNIEDAVSRGFSDNEFLAAVDETIYETRRTLVGRRIGTEPMRLKSLRMEVEEEGLRAWYPDEPLPDTPYPDEPPRDDLAS
ncbi:MAG TPA: hypothetical protein VLE91_05120 [Candidatus Saccharimonadales bacterium]|nr:hypothetical protein [Candidatus Saccharimonadales bacterium]